jgi:hypothetical protein
VGYMLPRTACKAAGDVNGAVCGMHTALSQSYLPLVAQTTLQRTQRRQRGMCDALCLALVSELVHALLSYTPSSSLPPILFPCLLLICSSWLTAPVGCGCRRPVTRRSTLCMMWRSTSSTSYDVVHVVVGAKRRGRDEATSTVLWQVEVHDAVMFVHVVKSEEKVGR